jgi:hypothetical protein
VIAKHDRRGAPGHRLTVTFYANQVEGQSDVDLIHKAEKQAWVHCTNERCYPGEIIALGIRAKPDPTGETRRFTVWVRPRLSRAASPYSTAERDARREEALA